MTFQELEKTQGPLFYYDVRDQLKRHIYGRSLEAFARGDAARDAIQTRAALERRQRLIRRTILRCIGGLPPSDSSLNARAVGVVKGRGYRIERIIFESRPKTFVTANLYLPAGIRGPRGAVLFLSGHHERAKHADEYQGVCQTLVQAGLIVFAQDPIGQGERLSYCDPASKEAGIRWGTMEHDYAGAQCLPLGDSIARYFLHDAMRGIDYLRSRPEVDPGKIGVTGNSGGGTQSSLLMLADPRVAAAAPGTFVMNRETYLFTGGAQDAEQIWPGFTAAGLDHEDILLGMCPKPVRVLAVQSDFFPIEGTRRTVERCRRIWKVAGKPSHLDLVEDATTHWFTPKLARAAAEFFCRHLLGRKPAVAVPRISLLPPERLWCTKSGQVLGEIPGARAVHDENRERVAQIERQRPATRKEALAWLRQRVFAHRKPCAFNPRFIWNGAVGDLAVEQAFWWSQEGLMNHGLLFRLRSRRNHRLPATIAVWDGGCTALTKHRAWLERECRSGRAVLVLEVSGAGTLLPNPLSPRPPLELYGVIHKFADDLLWLDDDLAALRTFDVLRAFDLLAEWSGVDARRIHCFGHGKHGVYAQLAAALDPRVRAIEAVGGIGSFASFVSRRHYDLLDIKSVVLRGILRYCDLPALMELVTRRNTRAFAPR